MATPAYRQAGNYYEHVIRDDGSLDTIREYILNNSARWELDSKNPKNMGWYVL